MKKILITGKNSYIGTSFEAWMKQFGEEYQIDSVSVKGDDWKNIDFSRYDVVLHLAAIVHVKEKNEQLYFQVNRDLAVEVAEKAKKELVKQFVFFSSMAVYGVEEGVITKDTPKIPKTPYGKSKLEGEKQIWNLNDEFFSVCILRPPMIYGRNSVGNYVRLSNLSRKISIFPKINNKRSMLYIDNLHCFMKLLIDKNLSGTFHPQNEEYVVTSDLVQLIGEIHGRKVRQIPGFSGIIHFLSKKIFVFSKVFGTLIYDQEMIGSPGTTFKSIKLDYQNKKFIESVREAENEK